MFKVAEKWRPFRRLHAPLRSVKKFHQNRQILNFEVCGLSILHSDFSFVSCTQPGVVVHVSHRQLRQGFTEEGQASDGKGQGYEQKQWRRGGHCHPNLDDLVCRMTAISWHLLTVLSMQLKQIKGIRNGD